MIEKLKVWGVSIAIALCVVAIFGWARSCATVQREKAEIDRLVEVAKAKNAGIPVEANTQTELAQQLADARRANAHFEAALANAREALSAALGAPPKVVEVVRYVTKPGPAGGAIPALPAPSPNAPIRDESSCLLHLGIPFR